MNGLLCCAKILGLLLFMPWSLCEQDITSVPDTNTTSTLNTSTSTSEKELITEALSTTSVITPGPPQFAQSTTTTNTPTTTSTSSLITTTAPWTFLNLMKQHSRIIIIICGALILACTILLISTLALTFKVCQLRRRLKTTGSNSEYWMGMDKTNKDELQPETKENCFLLTENGQTNQEIDNDATKQDGGKVAEEEQNGEKKEVGVSQESAEAATTAAPEESSPSTKPEEETTSSETTAAPPPPSSSEGTEEPKKDP